jgi:hypothetical protein
MRRLLLAVLAVPLIAAAPPRGTVALGIGAASSSEVVVKIAGKNVTVKLAGISNGTYAGQAFLQCLVASRIVRVDRAAGRVTLLDGTSVADHLAEFLQSRTSTDPCTLGKAAYVPQPPALASSVVVNPPGSGAPAPARREGHVSFGSGSALGGLDLGASPAPAAQRAPAKAPAAANDQPTIYNPPTMSTVTPQSTKTYTPPTQSTTTVGSTGTSAPPSTQTYTPPTVGTTTIPTTTQPPPP